MIEVHVEDRWDLRQRNVYILDRTPQGTHIFNSNGEPCYFAGPGQEFRDKVAPTFILKDEWMVSVMEKLIPSVPEIEQFVYDTVEYERYIIDRLLDANKHK